MGLLADVFSDDAFSLINMTEAVVKLPQRPSKLGDMGLFQVKGIATTTATVEELNGVVSLIQTQPRGTRNYEMKHPKRTIRSFSVPHIPVFDTVKADEIAGIRAFGAGDNYWDDGSSDVNAAEQQLKIISTTLNNRLQQMKNDIDTTKEWQRCGAIQGLVKDADGSTLLDLFSAFGLSQSSVTFDFSASPTEDVKVTCQKLCRKMIFALGATPYTGVQAICGDNFWDAFISSVSVKEAYKNYASNTMLQTQQRNGFMFADIFWTNYTARVGSTDFIPTNTCNFIPLGVDNIFSEIYAPANFIEAVNTPGKPYYAKQLVLPYEVGVELHAQSNPLFMVNRPGVLMLGTK